jgi:hypothetical protein
VPLLERASQKNGAGKMWSQVINTVVAIAILAAVVIVEPQPASARDRRFPDRRAQLSKADRKEFLPFFKSRRLRGGRDVIPAPNGNTGINGSGLPKPVRKGKNRPGRVIPAPNGNTGINGTGLPR